MCFTNALLIILLTEPVAGSSNQVDLFGQSLIDDLFDVPASVPREKSVVDTDSAEVDLFADATFVSAPTKAAIEASRQAQVRLFFHLNFWKCNNEVL